MKRFYKILRSILVTLIILVIAVPAALYIALSLPSVQQWLCNEAETELSKLLNSKIDIEHVQISPFNRVTLHGVSLTDSVDHPIAKISKLGAGVNIRSYLFKNRIIVDYAEIIGLNAHICRDSIGTPLNIQHIIDALQPKDKSKPPTKFDFKINTVVLRTSTITYDVRTADKRDKGFDPNHIAITDLRADIQLPQLKNDDFIIDLRRFAFNEQSGFSLKNLSAWVHVNNKQLEVKNFSLSLPQSEIKLNNQAINYDGFKNLLPNLINHPISLHLLSGSHLAVADISAFVPKASDLHMTLNTELNVTGTVNDLSINTFNLSNNDGVDISLSGSIKNLFDKSSDAGISVDIPHITAKIDVPKAVTTALKFSTINPNLRTILSNLANVDLTAAISANKQSGNISTKIASSTAGEIEAIVNYSRPINAKGIAATHLTGSVSAHDFSGAKLMKGLENALTELTDFDCTLEFDLTTQAQGLPNGYAQIGIESATFRGLTVNNLSADVNNENGNIEAEVFIDNQLLYADINAVADIESPKKSINFSADISNFDCGLLQQSKQNNTRKLSLKADGVLSGTNIDDIEGSINVGSVLLQQSGKPDFSLSDIKVTSTRNADADTISLQSSIADATISGRYHLSTIVPVANSIVARTLPVLIGDKINLPFATAEINDPGFSSLNYSVTIKDLDPLNPLVKLPVRVLDLVKINGSFDSKLGNLDIRLSAPYLQQGKKIIENTSLQAGVITSDTTSLDTNGYLFFTTTLPTKKGQATVIATSDLCNNKADTRVEWKIARDRDFSGNINISTIFSRNTGNDNLRTDIHINPSKAVFNDTVWTVDPASITVEGKEINVANFRASHENQLISINGRASENPADTIVLQLNDVSLDYVFETLNIPNVKFGGKGTGTFYATQLLTGKPVAFTHGLDVKNFTYNYSLLGDALIKAHWNNDNQSVALNADILQRNNRHSYVDGEIFVVGEALDLKFKTDKLDIGFLKPYMAAFATNVAGYASGNARLWGTFKLIDMVGDIYGEDVGITVAFTNCTYTTTDSVKLRPGRIDIDNITVHDIYGNTAKLNGQVRHNYFLDAEIDFKITDAKNLLVYDIKENNEQPWSGRIFGNGSASILGVPGFVEVGVNMSTAPNSAFTFELSNSLSAQDYKFITFRDRDQSRKDSIANSISLPPAVAKLKKELESEKVSGPPSNYKLDFNIDINQQALITLVMDPVGGDRIKAYGDGNLRMSYDSSNEDLRMNGTYTLERGSYNFTLQEIIVKDFKINSGSSITFLNDPYAAQLDLVAKYQVKANLTDLDESFREDKELNRTNVPVDALLMVKGDMRQPEISFDLDLPTLTPDTNRKVKSIISTDDMMSRQILYLLALNRFYTPEYMNNSTQSSELAAVASGTISSHLSNILGQISDNWAIAPNFRSDKGDFSDMEFDLALSSSLLNNRLLLNGNLGYRDKKLNNNSFIGDFDIEYLLNSSGTIRLKAYNRYNDQNYYFKSAQTTQGVGIMFKHNFDDWLSIFSPIFNRKKESADSVTTDSTKTSKMVNDSISTPTTNVQLSNENIESESLKTK